MQGDPMSQHKKELFRSGALVAATVAMAAVLVLRFYYLFHTA